MQNSNTPLIIITTILATALIFGGGIFYWQQQNMQKIQVDFAKQIAELKKKSHNSIINDDQPTSKSYNSQPNKNNHNTANDAVIIDSELPKTDEDEIMPIPNTSITEQPELPVVVYSRAGLLNNSPEGLIEKETLKRKLIDPYIDYQNEDSIELVALYIEVPINIGEPYGIIAIYGSENRYGTEEFIFGAREQDYDYWHPECMGDCPFSDAYRAKYPEVVR